MNTYSDCRTALLLSIYKVLYSVMSDTNDHLNAKDIKQAIGNVINRETFRAEARPDPRNNGDKLANDLISLCELQMIKEAFATIIMLDVCLGEIKEISEGNRRLDIAKELAGGSFKSIKSMLDPQTTNPETVNMFIDNFTSKLNEIAEFDI